MRVEGDIKPISVEINHLTDNMAEIIFSDNITEESKTFDDETKTIYVYDKYILTVNDRNGLEDTVKENLEQWLSYAKNNVDEKPLSASEQIEQLKSTVNSQAQIIDEVVFNIIPGLLNK